MMKHLGIDFRPNIPLSAIRGAFWMLRRQINDKGLTVRSIRRQRNEHGGWSVEVEVS